MSKCLQYITFFDQRRCRTAYKIHKGMSGMKRTPVTVFFNINLVLGHAPCQFFYVSYSELSTDDIFEIILGSDK